ncbi:MAG: DUF952 domain-containing protein [Pseudomonadota bacterium]
MLTYKIFRADEWRAFHEAGETFGAPVDLADGYIHTSTAEQLLETAMRHFAKERDLLVLAMDCDALGSDLKFEPSRGGALFPHLYRALRLSDVLWARPMGRGDGRHVLPEGVV